MATKLPNDMSEAVRERPRKCCLDSKLRPFSQDLSNLPDWLLEITNEPVYSKRADKKGTTIGNLVCENVDLVQVFKTKRQELINHDEVKKLNINVDVTFFENWGSTISGLLLIAKPKTVAEVRALIKAAAKPECGGLNLKVGCGGAYHSWTPLFPDPAKKIGDEVGLLLNMTELKLNCNCFCSKMEKCCCKRIKVAADKTTVTIVPGVTTGELLPTFAKEGICFESDVILMSVTYGGTLTTGCHGVGKDQTAMSDWISSLKLVNHKGDLMVYNEDTPLELMKALRVSMGVFGVVVEMTVKVKPAVTAKVQNIFPHVGELFYGENPKLVSLLQQHWSVQFLWFPFNSLDLMGSLVQGVPFVHIWQPKTDEVWVRTVDRVTTYAETNRWKQCVQKVNDTVTQVAMSGVGSPLLETTIGSYLVPAMLSTGYSAVKNAQPAEALEELPYAIHFRYGIGYAPVYDMEFAFPITITDTPSTTNCSKLLEAINVVVTKTEEKAKGWGGQYPLSTAMDIRVIKKSDCLLCPATSVDNSTHTAFIEILSFAGTQDYVDFFKDVAKAWIALGGAVPHWCKQWTFLDELKDFDIYDYIRNHYGPKMERFEEYRKKYSDKMFLNKTMEKLLCTK